MTMRSTMTPHGPDPQDPPECSEPTEQRTRAPWTPARRPSPSTQVLAHSEAPPAITEAISFTTECTNDFVDLTDILTALVDRSAVQHGQLTVMTQHTTATLLFAESESGHLNDLSRTLEHFAPQPARYDHDDHARRTENLVEGEPLNGHAHCRHALLGSPSISIPIAGRVLLLGRWQRVLFVELDRARCRTVIAHVQGTGACITSVAVARK